MKQFDVFENPAAPLREVAPFIVLLSSHLFLRLEEVIVAPVVHDGRLQPSEFDVGVTINGERYVVSVIGMAAIRSSHLGRPRNSLIAHQDDIRRALDRLFTGF
ncbi:CcdB family protein [Brevundimonas sp.]|uniref:CcdB family protein n=1 Tax=Brevundimonas sp. TaxID=1871086 RepID=UPI003567C9D9